MVILGWGETPGLLRKALWFWGLLLRNADAKTRPTFWVWVQCPSLNRNNPTYGFQPGHLVLER